ncbi:MAG: hypothetical protein HY597_00945 [Candidatus Omnitrophica bacterium]|nr:hypothetical protein [Candidatus Omnitrophota bacterium]
MSAHLAFEPRVRWRDCLGASRVTWELLDAQASALIGCPGVVVPSIRVALAWLLEASGFVRWRDQVLVPRFLGRCLLTPILRHALPVESLTSSTRLMLVVHQFGCDQQLDEIWQMCRQHGIAYVEDSPGGLRETEGLGPGSWGRFVSLSKVLPILRGAFFITEDERWLALMRQRRQASHPAAWLLFGWLMRSRHHVHAPHDSPWGDTLTELQLMAAGGHALHRVNIQRGLAQLAQYSRLARQRLARAAAALGDHAVLPATTRLPYVVPIMAPEDSAAMEASLRAHGFDAMRYHFDRRHHLLEPDYQQVYLLPLNPTIPQTRFEAVLGDLERIVRTQPADALVESHGR